MKKRSSLPTLALSLTLVATLGFTACSHSDHATTADNAATTTDSAVATRPMDSDGAASNAATPDSGEREVSMNRKDQVLATPDKTVKALPDIHHLEDTQNNLNKAVSDLKQRATQGKGKDYQNASKDSFNKLHDVLAELSQDAAALDVASGPRNEAPKLVANAIPLEIRQKLDQLKKVNDHIFDNDKKAAYAENEAKRWTLVADVLDSVHQKLGPKASSINGGQQLRQMASKIDDKNQMTTEPPLFDTTALTIGKFVKVVDQQRIAADQESTPPKKH